MSGYYKFLKSNNAISAEKHDSKYQIKFNKIYESIFKPASKEEVKDRQNQLKLEEFKEWIEKNLKIKYEDLFKPENINKVDIYGDGKTSLMAACYMGQLNVVKQLLEAGADPNIRDVYKFTALSVAKVNKRDEIANLLEQYGAIL